MSFPQQWNSVRSACFARHSLTRPNQANLLLEQIARSQHPCVNYTDSRIMN